MKNNNAHESYSIGFNLLFDSNKIVTLSLSVILSLLIIFADVFTAPQLLLSIFFVIPVMIVAWYNGFYIALIFSLLLPLCRFYIAVNIEPIWEIKYSIMNAVSRMLVFSLVSFVTSKLCNSMKQLHQEVKILEGLIPICANCKKIRDEHQQWQPMEKYITERSEVQFTHGICPDCKETLYGKYLKKS